MTSPRRINSLGVTGLVSVYLKGWEEEMKLGGLRSYHKLSVLPAEFRFPSIIGHFYSFC